MPSTTEAQARLMAARAHGWSPKNPRHKLPPVSVAKDFNEADKGSALLSRATKDRKKAKRAKGGPARDPLSTPPRSGRGALGSLGSTAKLGGLGDAARPRLGFTARPGAKRAAPGSALSGKPLPRPGRGSNALLATSALPYHEASDRLSRLHKRIKTLT